MARRRIVAGQSEVEKGLVAGEEGVLLQRDDPGAWLNRAGAPVRLDFAGDQLEQRGLAGAVAADEREPVALADREIQVLEQPAGALDQAQAFPAEYRCG